MATLVTGASGFIGSHLCLHLPDLGDGDIVGIVRDLIPSKWLDACLGHVTKVFGDLTNPSLIRRVIIEYGVDRIFHLAAQPVVKNALRDPAATYENNIISTVNVLEAARILEIPRTLVMSTDKIYGARMRAKESSPYLPGDPYSTSKICCDAIARSYIETYTLSVVIPRSCNAYGYDKASRIVPNTVRSCLRNEPPVIFKGEDTKRQYIYIEDLVETLAFLLGRDDPHVMLPLGPVNVAGRDLLSQEEVVMRILKFFPGLEPRYLERERPPEIEEQSMVPQPFLERFLKHSFDRGVEKTIRGFKDFGY